MDTNKVTRLASEVRDVQDGLQKLIQVRNQEILRAHLAGCSYQQLSDATNGILTKSAIAFIIQAVKNDR